MSDSNTQTPGKKLYFVTLKLSNELRASKPLAEIFDKREYSDEFIKSLLFSIDSKQMEVYGFVILSDQIHLIVSPRHGEILDNINKLKCRCAKETLRLMGKNLNSMDETDNRKQKALRKVFTSFLNSDESIFWQKNNRPVKLHIKDNNIFPIISDMLLNHLMKKDRNYLQIGADAFTKLMLETMKI